MGGRSSKNGKVPLNNGNYQQSSRSQRKNKQNGSTTQNQQMELGGKQQRMEELQKESFPYPSPAGAGGVADNSIADFYDGIPLYYSSESKSGRSRQRPGSKVSRLSRVGSVGLGKAVEVLDVVGSSMTNLNPKGGFASAAATKGNELGILALEVANTIVKGYNLMQSISKRSIRRLKEEVFLSEGVQTLVSNDTVELLGIVAADKRDEFKIFSGEVFRFGNRCKDPQWHNLDRYFEKISKEFAPQRQSKEEAESVMEVLMVLVQNTAELYQELQLLDKIEEEYQQKHTEDAISGKGRKDKGLAILRSELKGQKKEIRNLKKKSLWSRSLEEVMGQLVDIVRFLLLEIDDTFGREDSRTLVNESSSCQQRLGPVGLSLHYANMVLQIDDIVAQSSNLPPHARNGLYQSLPPNMKLALRSRLQLFEVKEELGITEIKDEMEKTLGWIVPMSTNTAKDHHGFGWVGEWANTGADGSRRSATGSVDFIRIESLHHADKEKTDAYILQLLLWLHHLVSKSKSRNGVINSKSTIPTTAGSADSVEEQSLVEDACEEGKKNGGSLETSKSDEVAVAPENGKDDVESKIHGEFKGVSNPDFTISVLRKKESEDIVGCDVQT